MGWIQGRSRERKGGNNTLFARDQAICPEGEGKWVLVVHKETNGPLSSSWKGTEGKEGRR